MKRAIIALGIALVAVLSIAEPAEARRGRGYHRHHVSYHRITRRMARRPTKMDRLRARRLRDEQDDLPEPKAPTRLLARCVMPPAEPVQVSPPLDPRWPRMATSLNPMPSWGQPLWQR